MFLVVAASAVLGAAPGPAQSEDVAPARIKSAKSGPAFVGRAVCASCHAEQAKEWRGSHHDLAMQVATEKTVLGNFDNATFIYMGTTSTFFRRGGKFFVRTDGPDGALRDFEIAYTFGVAPLQQYLIRFPGGRVQALGIAWDTRLKDKGGQRWFHLYPGRKIGHRDPLHWTWNNQTWNYQCAGCHSTGLQKRYDATKRVYDTKWKEINVSCEACHGPGSRHVTWATAAKAKGKGEAPNKGLAVDVRAMDPSVWEFEDDKPTAKRIMAAQPSLQIETCGRCHSRRGTIHGAYRHGRPLLDTHRLALLTDPLYHADGQINDEVYVHGSFLQSKMFRKGVVCTDCHQPHSLNLKAKGNAVCAQCHKPVAFDTPKHHFHKAGSKGAQCVECHMPAKTYLVVDPRRDHSLRVPRPDLSVKLGVPNACTGCHTDKSAAWATKAVGSWYGAGRKLPRHFVEAIHAGRTGAPRAGRRLAALAQDKTAPDIARATALSLLVRYPSRGALQAVGRGLQDPNPLVRMGAVRGIDLLRPPRRQPLALAMLDDPVRAVRLEAVRVLAPNRVTGLTPDQKRTWDKARQEYIEALMVNADRPEAYLSLATLHAGQGDPKRAEAALRKALELDERYIPAYLNLADLYRTQGRDTDAEKLLDQARTIDPRNGNIHHALGLLYVRQKQMDKAVEALRRAAESRPDSARYAYVYAVALRGLQKDDEALRVAEAAHKRHPRDREILIVLISWHRGAGAMDKAVEYARRLAQARPNDLQAQLLLRRIEAEHKRGRKR